ncbi:MAG: cell division protein FtsQ [Prevotella sp.]|nr:cell division protein FtsQ [Prevotella sp.]
MNWKKTCIIVLDVVLGAYIVMAMTTFDKPNVEKGVCGKVNIKIADEATNGFINTKEIKKRLQDAHIYPLGKPLQGVSLRDIEETLQKSAFVREAECYKTQGGDICINITQRLPIIRIKAMNGDDYYIDDNDCVMPNSHYTSDLIIATGNINKMYATRYVSPLAKTIMENDLWRNLIEQINITPEKGIELVPRVGNHIVYIGQLPYSKVKKERQKLIRTYVEKKLTRLVKFYKYGLSQAGWNKYSYINLEFDNQIICKKK